MCVALLLCGPVLAQAPIGPSTAFLNGTRLGLSVEYGQADADIVFEGTGGVKENFDFRTAYAGLSAALTERWEFFARLGGSQAETSGFDGDWNLSWGLGTRYTAFQWHAVRWGVLAQFTNLISQDETQELFSIEGVPTLLDATDELNLEEYVFATGPTWQRGRLSLYGGFLLRYLTGDFEVLAGRYGYHVDLDAQWDVGGYIGGAVTLFQTDPAYTYGFSRGDLVAEGRFTGDSTGFSVGLRLPFGGEY